uniref:Ascorbate-specific PTS system EIIA component n=1 Tax=Thermofilum pendens TaxID=2269 RepID=A0A7J3X8D1_THEPE
MSETALEIDLLKAVGDRILVGASARDWVEAVRLAGELLARSGVVEERYVEAMVKVTEELGPYAVLAPGIAMPHARPEDGAREVGLSLVVLKEGVNFGSPNDPVYVVIGFAAKDKTSHLKVLQQLAEFLSEPDIVEELKNVRSEDELKLLLASKLRKGM